MVRKRPHMLHWSESISTVDPDTGYTIPGQPVPFSVPCSYQMTSPKEIQNKDNETVMQKGKIFIDRDQIHPPKGATVKVEPGMFSGEVIDYFKGQLGIKLIV